MSDKPAPKPKKINLSELARKRYEQDKPVVVSTARG